ncbi:hypothetical protein DFH09DRAFT_1130912 [Mycena vulgaris]|nr:hypothetical protein DFH09DRAFT_1130912 [Mycena vulgaris]
MDYLSASTQNHTIFPTRGLQFLSAFIQFIGVTLLTYFLSRRLHAEDLTSRQGWERLTLLRIYVLLILFDSYLFMLSTGLLVHGVGMQTNIIACAAGAYICVLMYATSKVFIYLFLTEKVYIVWGNGVKRMRSPMYLFCVGTICLYAAVISAMIYGRVHKFRSGDGACIIGTKFHTTLPLLSFDLFINILLTALFLWPLLRTQFMNVKLKRVATRTLAASIVSLTTSTVNVAILTILGGRELGWLCLGSCGVDVIFNAAAVFWVTSSASSPTGSSAEPHSAARSATPSGASEAPMSQRSVLKPFNLLRSKPSSSKNFEIHVTTTSDVETSPRIVVLDSIDAGSSYEPKRDSGHSHKTADSDV